MSHEPGSGQDSLTAGGPRCDPVNGSAAGVEFALFLLPISIIHYLPNFFFGSLLMLFGVEILADWLLHSYKKAGCHTLSYARYAEFFLFI